MLRLQNIALTQFRNYDSAVFQFTQRVVGICGLNGKGKTNLLDSIYYLCFTKSYFSKTDSQNVQFEADGFRLSGSFRESEINKHNLVCIYRSPGKKELYLDDVPYEKFSAHIGKFPCVMVAPDDVEIISGGSEGRRKFIDTIMCQIDSIYLQQLIVYNKVLQQRNSLLKSFTEKGKEDWNLLDVLDMQLVQPGLTIYEKRKQFISMLMPYVKSFYKEIAGNEELIEMNYESALHQSSFETLLKENRDRDVFLQRTTSGVHKDDLLTQLNGRSFKGVASQGQRKSLLFAFKLAEFALLKENKGFAPLLLLDDVFEKLDDERMKNLLEWVCINNDGQVIITDTHPERLKESLKSLGDDVQIIQLP